MTPRGRLLRAALIGALALSALAPAAVLVLASLGRDWFFPALWPPRLTLESWASLLGGGRLGAAALTSVVLATGTGVAACVVAMP